MRVGTVLPKLALGLFVLAPRASTQAPAENWQNVAPPFPNVSSIALGGDSGEVLYAAASDPSTARSGAFRSTNEGTTWEQLAETLPGETANLIRVDPRDPRRVFATTVRTTGENQFATRVYRSTDAGTSWTFAGEVVACGGTFAFDTSNASRVYFALDCTAGLYVSEDAGATWQARGESQRQHLVAAPGGVMYAVDGTTVLQSKDAGYSWSALPPLPCDLGDTFLTVETLDIDAQGRLLAGTGHIRMIFVDCPGLFLWRPDAGWIRTAAMPVEEVASDESDASNLFAVVFGPGYGNVWGTRDGGVDWYPLTNGLDVSDLALTPSGRLLYAATSTGVFRLTIRKTRLVGPRPS